MGQDTEHPPAVQIGGRTAPFEEGVQRAARILRDAKYPLIYGLSRSSTPGQRAAVRLADQLGAVIDTTASRCHAPSIMALQEVGESTCTLGEIKNRADLVIFWGSNPQESHPRHFERYSVDPPGWLTPRGRADRHVVAVDIRPTATTEVCDSFVQVPAGGDFEAIWTLRALIRGMPLAPGCSTGADLETLQALAKRMTSCRCGVIFFGLGLAHGPLGHRNVEAVLRLVTDLNDHTRFHARRMRIPGDVAGADSVLCWQTGFPFSVNLSRGYPRYNPGEYSANETLARGEADCCLLLGAEGLSALAPEAVARLREIPTILLDYPTASRPLTPDVAFTTAVYGVHLPGTAYRMDEVPVPLRAVLETTYPSDADVLGDIGQALFGQSA